METSLFCSATQSAPHTNTGRQPRGPKQPKARLFSFTFISSEKLKRTLLSANIIEVIYRYNSTLFDRMRHSPLSTHAWFPTHLSRCPSCENPLMERENSDGQHPTSSALTEWNMLLIFYISTFARRGSCTVWRVYTEGTVKLWLTAVNDRQHFGQFFNWSVDTDDLQPLRWE